MIVDGSSASSFYRVFDGFDIPLMKALGLFTLEISSSLLAD